MYFAELVTKYVGEQDQKANGTEKGKKKTQDIKGKKMRGGRGEGWGGVEWIGGSKRVEGKKKNERFRRTLKAKKVIK